MLPQISKELHSIKPRTFLYLLGNIRKIIMSGVLNKEKKDTTQIRLQLLGKGEEVGNYTLTNLPTTSN